MQGHFQIFSYRKIVLAHHSLVVSAYLIEIEEKTSVDDIVKGILYSGLKLKYFSKKGGVSVMSQKANKENNKHDEVSQISLQ